MRRISPILTLLIALLMAALFTWPLLRDPTGLFLSRGFDGPCTVWMGWYMREFFSDSGLLSPISGWPLGEDLRGNDGWLHLLVSWLVPGLGTPLGAQLWGLLGCAASFLAAERMAARVFGARWPWSMVAGLVFACNGVAAAALAEGRFYHLAWWPLPLFLWGFIRLIGWDGVPAPERPITRPWLLSAATGLAWLACLGTSAYAAILALLGAAWLLLTTGQRLSLFRSPARLLPMLLIALPPAILFARIFLASSRLEDWVGSLPTLRNSATPGGLLGWSPAPSEEPGFASPSLGLVSLGLALASMRLLPRKRTWPLLIGAALATLASLGFYTHLSALHQDPIRTPWWLLRELIPALAFFRFPVRFLILAHLAFGVLAALCLSHSRGSLLKGALVLGLLLDAFFWATPVLQAPRASIVAFNTVYERAPRDLPLLDLLPHTSVRMDYEQLVRIHLACLQQTRHGRPLMEHCIAPSAIGSPAWELRRRLLPALESGDEEQASKLLYGAGLGAVALHPELFPLEKAQAFDALLGGLSLARHESAEGGERILLYVLDPARRRGSDLTPRTPRRRSHDASPDSHGRPREGR